MTNTFVAIKYISIMYFSISIALFSISDRKLMKINDVMMQHPAASWAAKLFIFIVSIEVVLVNQGANINKLTSCN